MPVPAAPTDVLIHGGTPLSGSVQVRGSKNLAPKAMVAALLSDEESYLENTPGIRDTRVLAELFALHGASLSFDPSTGQSVISPAGLHWLAPQDVEPFFAESRIPILMAGVLLVRCGRAAIAGLGGCSIGERAVDFHLMALQAMGARIEEEDADGLVLVAPDGLQGARIELPYPSVGATEQVLLAAVLAEGTTELVNAAVEPEITELIGVLSQMGARITTTAGRTITIHGVASLGPYRHTAATDRLETASWALAAVLTQGVISVPGARVEPLQSFLTAFTELGGTFVETSDGLCFERGRDTLSPVSIETDAFPGFSTDWHPPFATAMTQAEGLSTLHETVHSGRMGYLDQLRLMGANAAVSTRCIGVSGCRFDRHPAGHSAAIIGRTPLQGATLRVPDLRAGFTYVLAALTAQGPSTVENFGLLERGYENLHGRLQTLGAQSRPL